VKISKELIPVIEKYSKPVGVIAGQDIEEYDLVKPYSDGKVVLADGDVVSGVATHNAKENELVRIYQLPIHDYYLFNIEIDSDKEPYWVFDGVITN
jgi:hypothetical protein